MNGEVVQGPGGQAPGGQDPDGPVGVLLINLGTPESAAVGDVRRYLREFLNDPRVVDINPVGRWLLLNLIILPFRPAKSAEAYRSIWTEEGSPLLVIEKQLTERLQKELGPAHHVELAMRYGNPSVASALERLMALQPRKIIVVPLFPQYSSAAFGSAVEKVMEEVKGNWNLPSLEFLPPFYEDPAFIEAFAAVGREALDGFDAGHILFSYHGVPERQVQKSDPTGRHCLQKENCCAQMVEANRYCYKAQCYATSRALAEALGLSDEDYTTTFQSRLGRTPWIQPYTDELLPKFAEQGVKRLAIFCPAFVADCLETLEEIGMQADEDFKEAGGEAVKLIPSLNAHPKWVEALAGWIRDPQSINTPAHRPAVKLPMAK
ncbi:MAG: ferrochelatase [Myxococcota bacterium]